MIRLHTSPNAVEIHNLKNALDAQGIACEVRGELLRTGLGELPFTECWVDLWILDAAEEASAREVMAGASRTQSEPWQCPECGEVIEGQFDHCWNCQAERRIRGRSDI